MEMMIPFSGFYESLHSNAIDDAIDMDLADTSGNPNPGLVDHSITAVPWRDIRERYAREYIEVFGKVYGINGITMTEMVSPREYNFGTDRIFAAIPESEIKRLHSETSVAILEDVAAELFTSCDGFCSHYSPNVEDWRGLDAWDHNQLHALVVAWIRSRDDVPTDLAEFEDEWFDGASEFCLYLLYETASKKYTRLANIASYLRAREERQFG